MKKVLLVLALLFLAAAVGLGIFLATFDIDRFRPLIVSQLEQALGKPVTLERLSLAWRQGVVMGCQGFAVADDAGGKGEPLVRMDAAVAHVQLFPLLRKRLLISSVTFTRPQIHVTRDAQGRVNLLGLAVAGSPAAAGAAPATGPAGQGAAPLSFNVGSVALVDGALHWSDAMTQPPTDLWIKSLAITLKHIEPGQPMDVDLHGALGGSAPNVHLRSRVTLPGPGGPGSIERMTVTTDELPLDTIVPAAREGEPQLRGKLTLTLEGALPTLDEARWLQALSGTGNLKLTEGVLVNVNVLRTVFDQLSMLPGLVQTLESRLPPQYQAKLALRDTPLLPSEIAVHLENGQVRFDRFQVKTESFGLLANGQASLAGDLRLSAMVQIDPTLSAAVVESAKELAVLANRQGELELPVTIQGRAPAISITPDIASIALKIGVNRGMEVLGKLLNRLDKSSDQPQETPGAESSSQSPADQAPADPLGVLLEHAIQKATRAPKAPSQ